MTQGIKLIETYDHDVYCKELADAIMYYEKQGYDVELYPQIEVERKPVEFRQDDTVEHLYTCLVIAKGEEKVKKDVRA